MKIQFMAALAVSSLFALTACSDDGSESLADKCDSINEDCLEGVWSLQSINNPAGEAIVPFGAVTGKLTFLDDGTFSYEMAPNSSCDDGFANWGKWQIDDNGALSLTRTKGTCITERATLNPTVSVESSDAGDKAILNLNRMFFQQGEDISIEHNGVEIFSRTE